DVGRDFLRTEDFERSVDGEREFDGLIARTDIERASDRPRLVNDHGGDIVEAGRVVRQAHLEDAWPRQSDVGGEFCAQIASTAVSASTWGNAPHIGEYLAATGAEPEGDFFDDGIIRAQKFAADGPDAVLFCGNSLSTKACIGGVRTSLTHKDHGGQGGHIL